MTGRRLRLRLRLAMQVRLLVDHHMTGSSPALAVQDSHHRRSLFRTLRVILGVVSPSAEVDRVRHTSEYKASILAEYETSDKRGPAGTAADTFRGPHRFRGSTIRRLSFSRSVCW
ncbi:hypothetical protein GCM10022384_01950 [Streptomyces marokkonensis]|uniref:Uncharacterized protein n=1 Tax=Streptomyces marokkonensis TaxID=324855 RepID=A0ABP7NQ69_9ACTN